MALNSRPVINNNSPLGDEITTDPGTYIIDSLIPFDYTITVTDDNGCSVELPTQTIIDATVLSIGAMNLVDSAGCNGDSTGSASVNLVTGGTGGTYTYKWFPGTDTLGIALAGQISDTAVNLSAGIYTVLVKDSNSCSATGLILVEQPNAIDLNPLSFDSASCNGLATGSASVGGITGVTGGNGGYTYTWANALTPLVDLGQNNDTAINLIAGTYNIKVEDIKGCSDSNTVTVLQPDVLSLTDTILDSATCSTGGTALVKVTGGTLNYTYLWDDGLPGQNTDTATNLASGVYKVVVTDNNGCSDSITNVTVPVIGGPTVVIDTVIDVLCFGANTGGINITTNGVLPITYSWTGPNGYTSALEDITNLAAGPYFLDITDGNTCVTSIDTLIEAPTSDIFVNTVIKALKCFNDFIRKD